jgi:CRISPR-associated endonuclease Cas2
MQYIYEDMSTLSENINQFTSGLVNTASDLMLLSIFYNFNFDLNDVNKIDEEEGIAIEAFKKIPLKSIRRSLRHLRAKALVTDNTDGTTPYVLTDEGFKYLYTLIPEYKANRPWDGRLYLVTYDVPRVNNKQRNVLRDHLRQIGAGLLQHSVWVLPFNPKNQIEEIKNNYNLENAFIVISSFGSEGGVLGRSLQDIAMQIFDVSKANDAYSKFLTKHAAPCARERLIFHYINALKLDPQLPFELYPENWQGTEALNRYQQLLP